MQIEFKRNHPLATIPEYKTSGSVAFDISIVEDTIIKPGEIAKIRTGLIIKTPDGHALIIASRSSNPIKKGINLSNSIGVIDSDYCGPEDEIHLLVSNITNNVIELKAGDRIAQGLLIPIIKPEFKEIEEMTGKNRGGFGSTGM